MKENKVNISKDLSLLESKQLLKSLKLYEDLGKKLGNRGKILFKSIITKTSIYKIEYYKNASKKDSLEQGIKAFEKIFGDKPNPEDIILESKEFLSGGIKVYKDDSLLDLSFKKAINALK